MKPYLLIIGSLLAVAPVAAHDCRGYGHRHNGRHDCADCGLVGQYAQQRSAPTETLKGTVSEIHRAPTAAGVIEAWLRTPGSTILVRLGPADFLRQNGLTLNEGDSIAVKGYRAASSEDDVLIATEVEVGGRTLLLRSGRGRPLW